MSDLLVLYGVFALVAIEVILLAVYVAAKVGWI
jgi:hypothetical protein